MKKRAILLCLIMIILSLQLCSAITLLPATGKTTQGSVALSLEMLPFIPIVHIIRPLNGTYLTNTSLPLDFSQTGAYNFSYSLDNGSENSINVGTIGFNTSIIGSTRFNTSEGSHNLVFFVSNLDGNSSDNVTFYVNLTKALILYSHYEGDYRGNSTNFYDYTYEQLISFTNATFEDTRYGKVVFTNTINLLADYDPGTNLFSLKTSAVNNLTGFDNVVDFDNYINISFNSIYFNLDELPNFYNKNAIITFYNIFLSNPKILRDNVLCSDLNYCNILSYNSTSGTLVASVRHFSERYSLEGTPIITSSGGRGKAALPIEEVSPPLPAPSKLECIENWSCSEWGACSNGLQRRQCSDVSNCNTLETIPLTEKVCYLPEMPKIYAYAILAIFAIIILAIFIMIYLLLVSSMKKRFMKTTTYIIRRAYYHLDKEEIREAYNQYALLKKTIGEYRSKIPRKDLKRLHERGIQLYKDITKY